MREEADAVALRCGADLRVSALAADTPAAQRDALLHAGQLVVATPGQVAQVWPHPGVVVQNHVWNHIWSHIPITHMTAVLGRVVQARRAWSAQYGARGLKCRYIAVRCMQPILHNTSAR